MNPQLLRADQRRWVERYETHDDYDDGALHTSPQYVLALMKEISMLREALYTAMDIMWQGDDPSNERINLIESAAPDYEPGWRYVHETENEQ